MIGSLDLDSIKELITPALLKYGVVKASIFGSVARDEADSNSDIDLLVQFEDGRSLLDLSGLKIELEELLNRKVDVVTYNSLHPAMKKAIMEGQKQVYSTRSEEIHLMKNCKRY